MDKNTFLRFVPFLGKGHQVPVVPVVRLVGPIGVNFGFQRSISFAGVVASIEQAFKVKGAKAVALVINSPGGSPVQSTLIYKRIRALSEENGVPVFAFAEDAAASGGYLLALAGDEIYADASSVVGSIGVISAGFGFTELIAKIGVERRVYSAGERKSTLDAFMPEDPEDVARLKVLQQDIHEVFKNLVRERRGDLLTEADDKLFSGEFWTGIQAEKLGLIDGLGDVRSIMRSRFGEKVKLKVIGGGGSWLRRRSGFGDNLSGQFGFGFPKEWSSDLLATLEARSLWSRLGL